MATANQAAKALNDLSHLFCEEDNLAYEEVLADYFLNDEYFLNDDDGQDPDEEDYDQESFTECIGHIQRINKQ